MKWIIFLVLCCMAGLLIAWIYNAKKHEGSLAKVIVRLLSIAVFTLAAECVFIISEKVTVAEIAMGCYYASIDWLVLAMLQYMEVYTGVFRKKNWVRNLCVVFAAADTFALLTNVFWKWAFELQRKSFAAKYMIWDVVYHEPWFWLHLGFTYMIVIFSVAALAVRLFRTPRFYRGRFRTVLLLFLIVVALNGAYTMGSFPLDISIFLYCILAMQICYYSLFYKPTGLIGRTLSMVVADINGAVFCFDYWNHCVYANKRAKEYYPGETEKAAEKIWEKRLLENRESEKEREEWEEIFEINGQEYHFSMGYQKLRDKRGEYLGCFFTMIDKTDEIRQFEQEHYRITHDELTGLYNRAFFFQKVKELLQENPTTQYFMMCSNIKGFKLYNDLYGVAKGDELLKRQAEIMKSTARPDRVGGRISGDEFAMLFPLGYPAEKNFEKGVEKLREEFYSSQYQLHVYAGIYTITDREEPVSIMCDKAKMAIEAHSGDYNTRVTYYDKALLEKSLYERQIVGEFDGALERQEFCMFLQPQVSTDGRVLGAEALVRWQHPVRGLVYPGEFIDIFEKSGLIYRLDKYMWELAVKKLREWKGTEKEYLYLSVNISAKDFYYMDIYEEITRLVEKYEISPEKLKLEITETVLMTEMKHQLELLDRLRKRGFQIEMDDFGSGYSSLNMLKDIEVDVVKIDMGFLRQKNRKTRSMLILNCIIHLIRQLGMEVITEGVETKEQVEELMEMGCNMFQGYYFAKPMPVEKFEEGITDGTGSYL